MMQPLEQQPDDLNDLKERIRSPEEDLEKENLEIAMEKENLVRQVDDLAPGELAEALRGYDQAEEMLRNALLRERQIRQYAAMEEFDRAVAVLVEMDRETGERLGLAALERERDEGAWDYRDRMMRHIRDNREYIESFLEEDTEEDISPSIGEASGSKVFRPDDAGELLKEAIERQMQEQEGRQRRRREGGE